MLWDVDLQPETIISKIFTLNYPPRIIGDSFMTLLIKLGMLLFAFILYKLMVLSQPVSWVSGLFMLIACFALSYLLIEALALLRDVSGTRRLFAALVAMVLLAMAIMLL
jgi:hypothetical protein